MDPENLKKYLIDHNYNILILNITSGCSIGSRKLGVCLGFAILTSLISFGPAVALQLPLNSKFSNRRNQGGHTDKGGLIMAQILPNFGALLNATVK